ncbi:U6 snRNA-associated Sm-like protein LSm1 [Cladosporium halotolerans]|uniref:U6 snRNA-associated Sm-like protein LSm1 n=1 Tax=Cladosporium halotolerans TaxID=1052096 RepID=A0AB34KPP0_9PEZI
MENLNLHDAGPPGPPPPGQHPPQNLGMPPPVPQLPPQMFTTAAQLLDLTDKKLMVALRDGRKLIGVLRSWDQFGNLVLQDTIERLFVQNLYADIERGLFLVRGENVSLLGEIDLDKDDYVPPPFQQADVEKVFALRKAENAMNKKLDKSKQKKLAAFGFEGEHHGEAIL